MLYIEDCVLGIGPSEILECFIFRFVWQRQRRRVAPLQALQLEALWGEIGVLETGGV